MIEMVEADIIEPVQSMCGNNITDNLAEECDD